MIAAQGKNEYLVGPELSLTSDHLARENTGPKPGSRYVHFGHRRASINFFCKLAITKT